MAGTGKNEWMVIPKFQVDPIKLKHLAIICDGNRRAANSKNLNPWVGHRMGVEVIHGILEAGRTWELPISHFGLGLPKNWKKRCRPDKFCYGASFNLFTRQKNYR